MLELVLISIGLAMDTFAVSIATGCSMQQYKISNVFRFAFIMAFFQALMPLLGWIAGEIVIQYIQDYDHWIAAGLLSFIGGKMIIEGIKNKPDEKCDSKTSILTILILAIATSIDALAIGFSFTALKMSIINLVIACAITTFLFSLFGLFIGYKFDTKHKNLAAIIGGVILIGIGIKIVIEHLCV